MLRVQTVISAWLVTIVALAGCKSTDEPSLPAQPKILGHSSSIIVPRIINQLSGFYPGRTNADPLWASFIGARDAAASTGYYSGVSVMRIDTAGRPVWAKTYTMPTVSDVGAFAPCSDGGGLVLVRRYGTSAVGITGFLVTRIDDQGIIQWSNSYGAGFNSQFQPLTYGIVPTADGGSVVYGAEDENLVLFKLSPTGNLLWVRRIGFDFIRIRNPELVELPSGQLILVTSASGQILFTRFSADGQPEIARKIFNPQVGITPGCGQLRALPDGTVLVGMSEANGGGFLLQLNAAGHTTKVRGFIGNSSLADFDFSPTGEGVFILRNQRQHYFYHLDTNGQPEGLGQALGDNSATITGGYNRGSSMQVISRTPGICYSIGVFGKSTGSLFDEIRFLKTNSNGNNSCPAATQTATINLDGAFLTEDVVPAYMTGDVPAMLVTSQKPEVIDLPTAVMRRCQ